MAGEVATVGVGHGLDAAVVTNGCAEVKAFQPCNIGTVGLSAKPDVTEMLLPCRYQFEPNLTCAGQGEPSSTSVLVGNQGRLMHSQWSVRPG